MTEQLTIDGVTKACTSGRGGWTVKELEKEAKKRGISIPKGALKAKICELLSPRPSSPKRIPKKPSLERKVSPRPSSPRVKKERDDVRSALNSQNEVELRKILKETPTPYLLHKQLFKPDAYLFEVLLFPDNAEILQEMIPYLIKQLEDEARTEYNLTLIQYLKELNYYTDAEIKRFDLIRPKIDNKSGFLLATTLKTDPPYLLMRESDNYSKYYFERLFKYDEKERNLVVLRIMEKELLKQLVKSTNIRRFEVMDRLKDIIKNGIAKPIYPDMSMHFQTYKTAGTTAKLIPFLFETLKDVKDEKGRQITCFPLISEGEIILYNKDLDRKPVVPPNLRKDLTNCKSRFYFISFTLHQYTSDLKWVAGHQNALIFDNDNKTYLRVEPHGSETRGVTINEQTHDIEEFLTRVIKSHIPVGYSYIPGIIVCPRRLGPQYKQKEQSSGGFCVTWTTLVIYVYLTNPKLTLEQVIDKLLEMSAEDLLDYVKRFQSYIDSIISDARATSVAL